MIFFLAPWVSGPAGGIRVIHDYVARLNELGFPAKVWCGPRESTLEWLHRRASTVFTGHLSLTPGDVLVIPEQLAADQRIAPNNPVTILNQGHYMTFNGVTDENLDIGSYPGVPNAAAAIYTSRAIGALLEAVVTPGFPLAYVPVPLNVSAFTGTSERKRKKIAWMPRKRAADTSLIVSILKRRGRLSDWSFQALEDLSEAEVRQNLADTAIFIASNERDGFGLPPLEAMISGALVAGYLSDGGCEYSDLPLFRGITPPRIEPDPLTLALLIEDLALKFPPREAELAKWVEQTRQIASSRYGDPIVLSALTSVFGNLIDPTSGAPIVRAEIARHPDLDWHESITSRRALAKSFPVRLGHLTRALTGAMPEERALDPVRRPLRAGLRCLATD